MSRVKLINYYEKVEKDDDESLRNYANEKLINIRLPFRALVLGPTGTGKTNIVLNLVSLIAIWDKVVILAKNLNEKLYKYTIKQIQAIEKKQRRKILLAIDDIKDLPDLDDFDYNENTLLIVDDFVADDPKSLKPLEHIWLRGRKNGMSSIFISQSYFDTPKMLRKNSEYVFIKELGNPQDIKRIAREYALGVTPQQITSYYESTLGGDFTNFFLIDRFNPDQSMRFRHNFDPIQ